jgi:hypothetical protein
MAVSVILSGFQPDSLPHLSMDIESHALYGRWLRWKKSGSSYLQHHDLDQAPGPQLQVTEAVDVLAAVATAVPLDTAGDEHRGLAGSLKPAERLNLLLGSVADGVVRRHTRRYLEVLPCHLIPNVVIGREQVLVV